MDDIDRELLDLLCTKIGMLMEDHSAGALTVGAQSEGGQKAATDELVHAVNRIEKLAAAAQSIAE
ncbi:hypothetical protein [Erythrobacter sp. YT30]|uniref:hypothetical protein n=1 Tax=Erythrobacter sp. YT30 TaxID=1735012 RepID=UPI00076C99B6|nr:hypothetical protein [Erythrobacter sp. YT30]KWV91754.1 hypothetical protein AUC45_11150 [Erythrobacter sp. YT30]